MIVRAVVFALCALLSVALPLQAQTIKHATKVAQAGQAQQSTVNVTVKSANGVPLSGANITIDGPGGRQSGVTDDQGTFTLTGPPGSYTLTVFKGGYQSGTTDVTVQPDATTNVDVTMNPASLENLTVIGRTSAGTGTNGPVKFNISSIPDGFVTQQQIVDRPGLSVNNLVTEVPGVWVARSTNNPNTSFIIRGLQAETKTLIDGHPVGSSTSGSYLSLYLPSELLSGVDVYKGMGLTGAIAGYAAAGVVNVRTRDFSENNSAFLRVGVDGFGGTFGTALGDMNFLPGNKLSVILGASQSDYTGPSFGATVPVLGTTGAATINTVFQTYQVPTLTNDYVGWLGDFSNTNKLRAELAKIRYRFSDVTSLTGEMLAFQGAYNPQAGAYGPLDGNLTIPQCLIGGVAQNNLTTCQAAPNAIYNAPQVQNLVGQTVPVYTFFPDSNVYWNQPNFSLEFKTSFKNDTILFRPYAASIRRIIDGSNESIQPGTSSGWSLITNSANCQIAYVAATSTAQAKGPCFTGNGSGAPYVTNPTAAGTYFPVTSVNPNCSLSNPCYTTSDTNATNSGNYGFEAPYTTLETDSLFGYTFSYIHPVANNIYGLSYDYHYDSAQTLVNDASAEPAGCAFTLGQTTLATDTQTGKAGGPSTVTYNGNTYNLAQPGCPLAFTRPSPLSVPQTFTAIGTLALTGQFQLLPSLEFDWGNYFTRYTINGQGQDPGLQAAVVAAGFPASVWNATPILLIGVGNSHNSYNPHFAFVYRMGSNTALRFSAGSSVGIPYGSQISGLYTAAQSQSTTTFTYPNPGLLPETIVGYDLGSDVRWGDHFVFSGDLYSNTVFNPWYATRSILPSCPAGFAANSSATCYQSTQFNAGDLRMAGVEISLAREPATGLGFRFQPSFQRAFFYNLPYSLLAAAAVPNTNGEQLNSAGNNPSTPYARGYGEISWTAGNGVLTRMGFDYEGNNNGYGSPAFMVADAGVRVPIVAGVNLLISGENIFNYNVNSGFSTGIATQGRQPIYGQIVNGTFVNSAPTFPGEAIPEYRTFRFDLQKAF